jgi:hypothetical protein
MWIFTWQINVNEALSYINTEFLSKIKEGMVITKDYALDLGARYSQYAITIDVVMAIVRWTLFLTALLLLKKMFRRCKHINSKADYENEWVAYVMFVVQFVAMIWFFVWAITNVMDLVKRKFVPEVQMYQVIMDIKNGNTTSNDR